MYISTVSRSIIYTDKGKADNPQTAERLIKMTIEQMKSIAYDKMNTDISSLAHDCISFYEVLASLSAFNSVGLFSDVEYLDFLLRIRQAEHKRISH